MSHLRTCKMKLKNINPDIMTATFQQLLLKYNGKAITQIERYGTSRTVQWGIVASDIRGGYGVTIDSNGEVKLHGDDYGSNVRLKQFEKELEQTYTQLVIIKALQLQGYSVETTAIAEGLCIVGERL